MMRHILSILGIFLGIITVDISHSATTEDYQTLKNNLFFLKKVLHSSTKLNHTHEHAKNFSLLNSDATHNYAEVKYTLDHQWKSDLDLAEKTLIDALKYRTKGLFTSQTKEPNIEANRKALFLAQRSLTLSNDTLQAFYISSLRSQSKIETTKVSLEKPLSFQDLADAAYFNIQEIRKITSAPSFSKN